MFWKVLQWISVLASYILEIERAVGDGHGPEKRAMVLERATEDMATVLTEEQIAGCAPTVFLEHAGQIVDGVVGVMNCLGVLHLSSSGPHPSAPPPEASAPTSAPETPG